MSTRTRRWHDGYADVVACIVIGLATSHPCNMPLLCRQFLTTLALELCERVQEDREDHGRW